MPTEASQRAMADMRDLTMMEWYIIPLLALLFYIYAVEIKQARKSGNWEAIIAGATLFGMDFVNESVNGWIFHLTERSALWTTPGPTALRTMIGWNAEIMFMFAISGLIWYHTCSEDPKEKILGINNRWFWAITYSAFCVFIEWWLNVGDLLIWEYAFWNRTFFGVWLIFLFGYFHFYVACILVLHLKTMRNRLIAVGSIWGVAILLNIIGMGILGFQY
jgi:hypothetical protein